MTYAARLGVGTLTLLALAGCGRDFPFAALDGSDDLRIVPGSAELFRGQQFRFDVVRTDATGAQSVLGRADLEVLTEPDELASVTPDGRGQALIAGSGELVARYLGQQAIATLQVLDATLVGITVEPSTLSLQQGARAQLRVTGQLSDGTDDLDLTSATAGTSYRSSNEAVVAVDANGSLLAVGAGTAVVTAQNDAQTAAVRVEVVSGEAAVVALSIEPNPVLIPIGEERTFDVLGERSDGSVVSLIGSPELNVEVQGGAAFFSPPRRLSGAVTGAGQVIARFGQFEARARIEVVDTRYVRLDIEPDPLVVPVGGASAQLMVFGVLPDGSRVEITESPDTSYAVDRPGLVNVTSAGVVSSARTTGETTVTVRNGPLQAQSIIRVEGSTMRTLVRIEAGPSPLILPVDGEVRLQVTAVFSDGSTEDVSRQVELQSQDEAIAFPLSEGRIRARAPGQTNFQVTFQGERAEIRVVVQGTSTVLGLEIRPSIIRIQAGQLFVGVEVIARFSDGSQRTVTFDRETLITSTDPAIARWTGMGVEGVNAGEAFLDARYRGVTAPRARITVFGGPPPPLTRILLLAPPSLGVMESASVQVRGILADGSQIDLTSDARLQLTSSDPAVLSVAGTRILGLGAGRATLTARVLSFTDAESIEVRQPNDRLTAIEWQPGALSVDSGQSAEARVFALFSSGRSQDVTNDPGLLLAPTGPISVVRGMGSITVNGLNPGRAAVNATYRGFSDQLQVTVRATAPTVVRVRVVVPSQLQAGSSAMFSVVADFSDSTTRNVSSDPGLSLSVLPAGIIQISSGTIRGVSAGRATITARFGGVTGTASVQVNAASDPVVRLEFQPASLTIDVNQTAPIRLFAVRQSGQRDDITTDPRVSSSISGPLTAQPGTGGTVQLRGTAAGTATFTARFSGLQATLSVTVRSVATVRLLIVRFPTSQVEVGQRVTYTVEALLSDSTRVDVTGDPGLSVMTSDASILRLESPSAARGAGIGLARVTFSYRGVSTIRTIRVIARTQLLGLLWSPGQLSVPVGQTRNARLFALRSGASSLDVTTSTETSFSASGPITTRLVSGSLEVRGTTNGNAQVVGTYRGLSATLFVPVGTAPRVIRITVSPTSPLSLDVGDTQQLSVTAVFSNGTTQTVTSEATFQDSTLSSQGNPIDVSSSGLVRGRAVGQGRVTVRARGFSQLVVVNVSAPPPRITTLTPSTLAVNAGLTTLTVNGASFTSGDRVFVNGTPVITSFVNSSRLTFTNAGPLFTTAGTRTVQVRGSNGASNSVTLRLGVPPNVSARSPTLIIPGQSLELTVLGTGLTGVSYSGAPLSFVGPTANTEGTRAQVEMTVPATTRPTAATVTVTNDFGSDTFSIGVVRPTQSLTLGPAQARNLQGTNAFSSVNLSGFSGITTSGDAPVVILSAGNVTIPANSGILMVGQSGRPGGLSGGAGGDGGAGGSGGGGGGDGNAPAPASGGDGTPAGSAAATSAGAGTAAGDGGGVGGGIGASGGCAQGGGGAGRGGAGGRGGGDTGVGTGGAGGAAGLGSNWEGGNGGGGGSTCGTGGGGGGGGGGGALIIQVATGRTIRIDGEILGNGGNGGAGGTSGGGGGGSGGLVELRAPGGTVVVGGNIRVEGGDGGDTSTGDAGGGGAGGVIILEGTSINAPSNRLRVGGGDGGTGLRGNNGQDGQSGQVLRNP